MIHCMNTRNQSTHRLLLSNWFVQIMRVMLCNNLTCLFLKIFNDLQIDTNRKCRAISQGVLNWNIFLQTSNHWLVGWVDCKMSDSSMRHTKWNSRREFRPGRKRNSINDKSILKPKTNLLQKSCWFAKFGCVPAKMPWTQITAHTNTHSHLTSEFETFDLVPSFQFSTSFFPFNWYTMAVFCRTLN